jgi:hypothetical protein
MPSYITTRVRGGNPDSPAQPGLDAAVTVILDARAADDASRPK